MSNAYDVLVGLLQQAGVRQVFGIPGDSINIFTDSLRRQDRIQFIHVNHEEAGAFAASGQAKLTGRLGVCVGTSGPGAIHLLNGLYDAKGDHAPVLAITGQIETKHLGSDYQQEVDLHRLFGDVAVYNQMVASPEQLPYVAARAIHEALLKRGVAHLNLPFDIGEKHVGQKNWNIPFDLSFSTEIDDEAIDEAAKLLNSAGKIAILAGIGCLGAEDKVFLLAEALGAPIIHALRAKELFLETHPYSIGGLGNLGVKPSVETVENCEVLFMIGTDFPYSDFLPKKAKVIQLDSEASQIGKRLPVEIGLVGDTGVILEALLPQLERKTNRSFLKAARRSAAFWKTQMQKEIDRKSDKILPQRLAYLVGELAGDNAVFVCDTGEVTFWVARYLEMRPQQRFTVSGSLASMAFALPAAIGAKLAYPHRQVIALAGDGGFSMLMSDFATAVRYKLPIAVIVFNNRKLGMIQIEQEGKGLPNYQTENFNPDFAGFAKLCGGDGLRISDPAELEMGLRKALASPVPFVLDVQIDPDEVPIPPKITTGQAMNFGLAKIKEWVGRA